jgi:hypothetical protein
VRQRCGSVPVRVRRSRRWAKEPNGGMERVKEGRGMETRRDIRTAGLGPSHGALTQDTRHSATQKAWKDEKLERGAWKERKGRRAGHFAGGLGAAQSGTALSPMENWTFLRGVQY